MCQDYIEVGAGVIKIEGKTTIKQTDNNKESQWYYYVY